MEIHYKYKELYGRIVAMAHELDVYIVIDKMWIIDRTTGESTTATIKPEKHT